MKLEKQVCSLDLAKRLKELGVKQESLFWWRETYKPNIGKVIEVAKGKQCFGKLYSAFTVAELGEMLPRHISRFDGEFELFTHKIEGWQCGYFHWANLKIANSFYKKADTEANARAKMLVYLLENKLIKI